MSHFIRTNLSVPITLMLLFIGISTSTASRAAETDATPLVIAHRGASGYLPEHTLPAVALAHGLGADFIEQDILLSKDNEPIVIHDRFLDYVTNVAQVFPNRKRSDGHYYVADFTLVELRNLRVHERTNPATSRLQFPARFPLDKGNFTLATLAEHIELIQGLNHTTGRNVGLLVEIKDPAWQREQGQDPSRVVLETLKKYDYKTRDDNAILQCFDVNEVRRLRTELHTDLRLIQLMNEQTLKLPADAGRAQLIAALEKIATHADGIGPSLEMLLTKSGIPDDPQITDLIDLAHDAGLEVYCYTFRSETVPPQFATFAELVEAFTAAGLDGFITDYADKVREHLPAPVR